MLSGALSGLAVAPRYADLANIICSISSHGVWRVPVRDQIIDPFWDTLHGQLGPTSAPFGCARIATV